MRRTRIALSLALFLSTSLVALAEDQAITVGPWTIATTSRGDKFDSCTMSRSTNDLDANFIRDADGLLLLLESSKWRLERGKAYPVTGQRSLLTAKILDAYFQSQEQQCTFSILRGCRFRGNARGDVASVALGEDQAAAKKLKSLRTISRS